MNKQIEDLGKKLRAYAYDMKLNDNDDCQNVADFIITTLGYRKTEDIARDIFAEINEGLSATIKRYQTGKDGLIGDLRIYLDGKIEMLKHLQIMLPHFQHEIIKKKYESEGADDDV